MENYVSSSSTCQPKVERKVIEKNRRNQMKALFSKLSSLLPPQYISKDRDGRQLPEQIDEAANYIKSLEANFDKLKDKKDKLLRKKRSHEFLENQNQGKATRRRQSRIEIYEMGPDLDVILITGLDDHFVFNDIIRFLNEHAGEILHADLNVQSHSNFHIVGKKIATKEICRSLEGLIDEFNSFNNQELIEELPNNKTFSDLALWDFEIQSDDIWDIALNPGALAFESVGNCYTL